jgi:hypothetical protein
MGVMSTDNWLKETSNSPAGDTNTAPTTDEENPTNEPKAPGPIGNATGWMLTLGLGYFGYTLIRQQQKTNKQC